MAIKKSYKMFNFISNIIKVIPTYRKYINNTTSGLIFVKIYYYITEIAC